MGYQEFSGKTVEDAITEALVSMGTTSDKIEYEVIEEGSTGLFGMFSKEALIKVRTKEEAEAEAKAAAEAAKAEPACEPKEEAPCACAAPAVPYASEAEVRQFISEVLEKMEMPADVEIAIDETERVININLDGEDTGDLIGKRGATLDALQYLVSIVANKKSEEYYRVKLDTKDFRERRQKTLENLAKNVASKAKKTHRKVVLDPMNPYERRIIHSYLQNDPQVTTKSEGEEPNRKVVVYYKR